MISVGLMEGDCLDQLPRIQSDSVDLIMTSPPYADQRKKQYGGIHPEDYVDWFLPRSLEMMRVLKPTGSFILNIKESAKDGQRLIYVLELILALREQGWLWIDEFIWHKSNPFPGGDHRRRMKDGWERLIHLSLSMEYSIKKDSVAIPPKESTLARTELAIKNRESPSTSPGGMNIDHSRFDGRLVYPSNVLYGPSAGSRGDPLELKHPARFPRWIPEWFIRLFTDEGDVVLDPFVGSGTTLLAAIDLDRRSIGIEISSDYCDGIETRLLDDPNIRLRRM